MYKVLSLFVIFLFACSADIIAQCDQAFIDNCSSSGGTVKYIKHFRIRFEEAKSEKKRSEGQFSIMLNKGNHYRFLVCNDESKPGSTIIELANDFSKYGGNFNTETNKEYKAFDFVCTKTGPYYLKMFFKDGKEGCGVCVLSLVMN